MLLGTETLLPSDAKVRQWVFKNTQFSAETIESENGWLRKALKDHLVLTHA